VEKRRAFNVKAGGTYNYHGKVNIRYPCQSEMFWFEQESRWSSKQKFYYLSRSIFFVLSLPFSWWLPECGHLVLPNYAACAFFKVVLVSKCVCDIWGDCIGGLEALQTFGTWRRVAVTQVRIIGGKLPLPSSVWKKETGGFSETLVPVYQTVQYYISGDSNLCS
jgi:hypothetical protein